MSDTTFKALDADNWLEPDPVHAAFVEFDRQTGECRALTGQRWAEHILSVSLASEVPEDVRDLWDIARGVLLYGWFFYPLYALGDEQLHRVADAAILFAYRRHGGPEPNGPPSFHRRLSWLFARGHIDRSGGAPLVSDPRATEPRLARQLSAHRRAHGRAGHDDDPGRGDQRAVRRTT